MRTVGALGVTGDELSRETLDALGSLGGLVIVSSRRRQTSCLSDWSSDVCSSDLNTSFASGEEVEESGPATVREVGKIEAPIDASGAALEPRSEERRVGKECR